MQNTLETVVKNSPSGVEGMTIQLTDAGKRFNRDWIFRHVNYTFQKGKSYAITGPNGSGKSTLLQAIASSMNVSEGYIQYTVDTKKILEEDIYQHVSIAAPYLEVIEEMSAKEFLLFHSSFKPLLSSVTIDEIIKIIGLEKTADKQIRYFSSGMKQRIKLAQAIFSDADILLLDEPCTNLDATGYALYHQLIKNYCNNKLIIVSSNDENEMDFCEEKISIMDYK
ncbi:MAG TPA: ABC transporter ATP-binding protein [Chitinophagaceae bacterium]|nr:ABC transporter ATP-binding protein [Chitinophagaceae bacterium]